MRVLAPIALAALSLPGCVGSDNCGDIACVMSHIVISSDGQETPLTPIAVTQLPQPTAPMTMTTAMPGGFQLAVMPLSSPNWGDPIQMLQAGVFAHEGMGSQDAALTPTITNMPTALDFTSSAEQPLPIAANDPNGCAPALFFVPYDPFTKRFYPHCVWGWEPRNPRDQQVQVVEDLVVRIRAGLWVNSPIDFSLPPSAGPCAALPPSHTCPDPIAPKPCGDGCIPKNAVCCQTDLDPHTTSYCTNSAGGARDHMCFSGPACTGTNYCCDPSGNFAANECPAGQHHCGLLCYGPDHPCCPPWMPGCGADLVAGPTRHTDVVLPIAPPGGGGGSGGSGGGGGGPCGYDGTYSGEFNYTWAENMMTGSGTVHVTLTLQTLASAAGNTILYVTSVSSDEPSFAASSAVTPNQGSVATLPSNCAGPSQSGNGIGILFPNGTTLGTTNGAGDLVVGGNPVTLGSSNDPSIANSTWTLDTMQGADSNSPGSGPGGHIYNATRFTSWTLVHQ